MPQEGQWQRSSGRLSLDGWEVWAAAKHIHCHLQGHPATTTTTTRGCRQQLKVLCRPAGLVKQSISAMTA
jgi:hypothetical protein